VKKLTFDEMANEFCDAMYEAVDAEVARLKKIRDEAATSAHAPERRIQGGGE